MERLLQTLPHVSGTTKGDNGRVGVVGGSIDFPGQPTITGMAALRTGSDVVKTLTSEEVHPIVASHSPNLLAGRYSGQRFADGAADRALELGEWADALVIGPGLLDAEAAAVERTITGTGVPVVVDAAAIDLAMDADLSGTVFTPDDREKERITEEYGSLEEFSETTGAVVVWTGDVDTIVVEGKRSTNETGTSALTVAGTGDTMAGIIAALIGQGLDRENAAELGAWIVGKAGELATAEKGNGVIATDVIERIPDTIR